MQAHESVGLRNNRLSRISVSLSLKILTVIIAVLIVVWSLFWYVAARETESLLQAWIEREKSVDRLWSCSDRQISGYPFKIDISCEKAGFEGEFFGKQMIGSLKTVHVNAALFHPNQADAVMEPPFELRSQDGDGEVALQWNALRVHLNGLPQDVTAVAIDGSEVSLRGGWKGLGPLAAHAGMVSSVLADIPQRRAEDAYSFHLALEDASIPVLDSLLGSTPPDVIKLDGAVTKAGFALAGTLAERMERWRLAGGRFELSQASITRGTTKISGRGTVQFDDQHRPQGQLDAEFAGAEPLLKRFGINPAIVSAGSLLSTLLGARPKEDAPADTPPSLHLPVTVRSGLVSVGPVKTSIAVPPLY